MMAYFWQGGGVEAQSACGRHMVNAIRDAG